MQFDSERLREHLNSVTASFPSPIDSGAMLEEVEEYWAHREIDPGHE